MKYPLLFLAAIQLFRMTPLRADSWPSQITRGDLRYTNGLYRQAIAEYEQALPLAESPLDRAVTEYRLGLAHGKLAQYTAAEQSYREAVALLRKGGDSAKLAMSLAGLAEVYRAQRRLDDALATADHSLRILQLLGMFETREAANVLTIKGEILYGQHRFKAAQRSIRQSLSILEKAATPDNIDVAANLNGLGVIAVKLKHPSEAESLLKRALFIREAQLGSEHPLVASTLLSLSSAYLEQKKYADAEKTCQRSLTMMQQFLPAGHPLVIEAYLELALIAHSSGKPADAIGDLEKSIAAFDTQRSAITEEYVRLLNVYARYLSDAGETEKSRKFRLEARQLLERSDWKSPTRSIVALGELEGRRQ